jgi:putative membrane protein
MKAWSFWLACALPGLAWAHQPGPGADLPAPGSWSMQAWVIGLLLATLAGYGLGAWRVWRRAGWGRGVRARQAGAFALGWLALGAALVSPLDPLGAWLFSAHMVQHELLMIVAAPLLVLGRPLAAWTWAFGPGTRPGLGRLSRLPAVAAGWRALTGPLAAWLLHALALWLWHVPAFFDAALHSEPLHVLQHLSFLASALLFWWAVLGGDRRVASGVAMALLFTTMLHTGILGALLTLAPTPWYPWYADTSAALGFDPLEDQQLGGLVMWVPGGLAYLVAGLVLAAQWLARRAGPLPSSGRPG